MGWALLGQKGFIGALEWRTNFHRRGWDPDLCIPASPHTWAERLWFTVGWNHLYTPRNKDELSHFWSGTISISPPIGLVQEVLAIHWNSMWIKNSLMRNSGPRIMLIIDIDLGFLLREVGNLIWEINIQSGAVNNDGPCKGTWDIIVSPCFCSPVTESEKKWKGQSLSGVWLCNPMDCVTLHDHGILQARILEWVVTPFSKGSSQPRDRTQVSYIARDSLPSEPPGKPCHRCSD